MTRPGIEPATSRSQSGRSTTEPLCRYRKLVVKYVPTYTKVTLKKKRSAKDSSNDAYAMFLSFFCFLLFLYENVCCWYSFELHRSVDAIQMGNHNICLYKEVDKKYTGCNLKTTELFASVLIGVYAVIRLNLVSLAYCPFDISWKEVFFARGFILNENILF